MRIKDLLVISACDSSMKMWGELWIEQTQKFAVDWRMYDLGGFGHGEPFECGRRELTVTDSGLQVSTFKPRLILDALRRYQRPVLWLDADAYVVHHLHDVLAHVDVAVTVKRPAEWEKLKRFGQQWAGTVNSGVFLANPTSAGAGFVEQWAALAERLGADQTALSRLVENTTERETVGSFAGARVRLLQTEIYNSYYFAEEQVMKESKIIHFKGSEFKAFNPRDYGIGTRAVLPEPSVSPSRLRIGQRGKGKGGWVHLDSHPSADVVAKIPPLPEAVKSQKWNIIEGIHVWEHFYKWEAEQLAKRINDALDIGGKLILECPNLEIACRSFMGDYKDSDRYHMHVFYGDPRARDPSYGHRWGYTPESLKRQLVEHGGFPAEDVQIEPAQFHVCDRDFRIVATKR